MTTLTQASIMSRKGIRYIIYTIIFLIVARLTYTTGISLYNQFFPPPPPPPTLAFGKLSKIQFPEKVKHNLSFTVETAEGGLPVTPAQVNVFFMPKISPNLLSLDFAKEKATNLGFNPESQQISESLYKFYHKQVPSTFEIDIITNTFSISYDLNADPTPLSIRPPQQDLATSQIRSYLSSANFMPEDLSGPVIHQYLKTQAAEFIPAVSLSDANLIRVDLFRRPYDEMPVVTKSPTQSNVWFMLSGFGDKSRSVVAGEYHYFPVDETQASTYPIITSDAAWQELTSGNYYPASLGTTTENESIKIRKVYLAYYDSGLYTQFLEPIYVFEGDKNFVGYVPAVVKDYYGE